METIAKTRAHPIHQNFGQNEALDFLRGDGDGSDFDRRLFCNGHARAANGDRCLLVRFDDRDVEFWQRFWPFFERADWKSLDHFHGDRRLWKYGDLLANFDGERLDGADDDLFAKRGGEFDAKRRGDAFSLAF